MSDPGGANNGLTVVDARQAELADRGYDVDHPRYFPSIGEYTPRLESHGFEGRSARLFARPTELENGAEGLANWIEMFGGEFVDGIADAERDAIIEAVEARLRPELLQEGSRAVDYRRLRFVPVAVPTRSDR